MTRLACFTLLLAGLAAHADGGWQIDTITDAQSYQPVTVLWQESAESISDEYGAKQVRPRLEFRCTADGELAVRIDWQRFISSFNTEVTFSAADAAPLTVKLGVDRANKVTMTRTRVDDAALLDYVDGVSSLEVSVTPYSEAPVSVTWGLDGLDERLAELRERCAG